MDEEISRRKGIVIGYPRPCRRCTLKKLAKHHSEYLIEALGGADDGKRSWVCELDIIRKAD